MIFFLLFVSGVMLLWVSYYVSTHHKKIWKEYQKTYKKPESDLMDWLQTPRKGVYWFNVHILWPLVAAVGFAAVAISVFNAIIILAD